ncbi:ATP-binding cassette domain-containing protein [Pseudoflavonifractor sp. BIOML-A6]|nr:ATP-binding cassette domain-containing protein [Pseudoflavonifractor sp. BIOML-A16]MTR05301.1 ATP-binding cassette domain-containing protein [Pseudoflavonifractor sp. BIOML-A15]MTR12875.1 ATP-binding cassette domain-containing protein [Pseudoflavonifractor sp. BIOML-A17]MTR21114.1 ATP-binding cassette domain-containing protein [Pseudoflavonifractor sp. BIOML-A19]MTR31567.1 ATP-binding cassette domain-containing protein [Pseudoflavonifractor sp. BIOML-A14]MTR35292.1 ATP-binding cassette doma
MKNRKKRTVRSEDIPRNTKAAVRRLLGRMASQKKKLTVVAAATLLSSAAFTAMPLAMGLGIDRLVAAIRTYDGSSGIVQAALGALGLPVALVAAAFLVSCVLSYVQQYIIASVGEELTLSLRKDVSAKLSRLPLRYFDTHKTGDIMSRVTNDLEKVSSVMQVGLMQLISSGFTIVLALVTMLALSPGLLLVVLVSLAVSMAATGFVSTLAQKAYAENMASMGALTGKVEEIYAGNREVKVFNQQQAVLEAAEELNRRQFRAQRKAQFADYAIYPAIRLLGQLGFIATAVLGGGMALGGAVTLGTVQAFLQYVNQISEPVTEAAYVITSLQAAIAGAERVFALLDEEEEVPEERGGAEHITQGRVTFQNVRFGYTPDRILMKDLNLEVRPNEMVAIVGPTGGGKTTLVNLLMRFYELSGGSISIDGRDITTMSRSGLRRRIGMVLQDAWLFEGTIAENIAYGKMDATREEIAACARAACCDHFIRTLPQGYDTILSGEASGVSQGQMQLLTIARAMLTDPAILVLDEATSSVDTRTEMEIQKAMARLMEGKTSFVIAHRLSTIQNADMILVVRDGDIVERGSHAQLLEQNGFYASLYRSQFEAA